MRLHTVELESFEAIVPGGVRRVTWLVENDGEFCLASELPGASVEARDTGPRVVWVRRVTVALAPGTRLVRVESAPKRTPTRDPLAYLFEPKPGLTRETRRSQFVVGAAGKLERVTPRARG